MGLAEIRKRIRLGRDYRLVELIEKNFSPNVANIIYKRSKLINQVRGEFIFRSKKEYNFIVSNFNLRYGLDNLYFYERRYREICGCYGDKLGVEFIKIFGSQDFKKGGFYEGYQMFINRKVNYVQDITWDFYGLLNFCFSKLHFTISDILEYIEVGGFLYLYWNSILEPIGLEVFGLVTSLVISLVSYLYMLSKSNFLVLQGMDVDDFSFTFLGLRYFEEMGLYLYLYLVKQPLRFLIFFLYSLGDISREYKEILSKWWIERVTNSRLGESYKGSGIYYEEAFMEKFELYTGSTPLGIEAVAGYFMFYGDYSRIKKFIGRRFKGTYYGDIDFVKDFNYIVENRSKEVVELGSLERANRFLNSTAFYGSLNPRSNALFGETSLERYYRKMHDEYVPDTKYISEYEMHSPVSYGMYRDEIVPVQYELFLIFIFTMFVVGLVLLLYNLPEYLRYLIVFFVIMVVYNFWVLIGVYSSAIVVGYHGSRFWSMDLTHYIMLYGFLLSLLLPLEFDNRRRSGLGREGIYKLEQYERQKMYEIVEVINFIGSLGRFCELYLKINRSMRLRSKKNYYIKNMVLDINIEEKYCINNQEEGFLDKSSKGIGYPLDEYPVYGVRLYLGNKGTYIKKSLYNNINNMFYIMKDIYRFEKRC